MDQKKFDEEHLLGFLKAIKAHIIKKVALAFGAGIYRPPRLRCVANVQQKHRKRFPYN